jgi:2-polyprenyl-3-methyl-5-hydroxy-6-metoxy-1,4-benzoquinol methylase
MPDECGTIRMIYGCHRCAAMTPDYRVVDPLGTASQIAFHERYWQETDGDALQIELADLMGVVASLRPHLGAPASGKRVFEIGAGRGGLLRALRDAGYDAHGCEPASALVAIAREHYDLGADVLTNIDVDGVLQATEGVIGYSAVFLWHVLEHLSYPMNILDRITTIVEQDGVIIIQVPLLRSNYIYPEHYYFCSHDTFSFIAKKIGFSLEDVSYDEENLFATAVFRKNDKSTSADFLGYGIVPDALSQIVILNERSKAAYRNLVGEIAEANRQLDGALTAYRGIVDDRDASLAAWEKLAEDRLIAMTAMEQLINDGLAAIATQAAMIDQRDSDVALLRQRLVDVERTETGENIAGD